MKFTYILFASALLAGFILFQSHQSKTSKYHETSGLHKTFSSANPPAGRTGAPGESNCTVSCHLGTAQSASGIIDVTFSGAGNEYVVGQTYSITISIGSGAKNGFQATILDNANTKAGTFISGTNSGVTTFSGRQYVRHTVSSGVTSWTFDWTAPPSDLGDLTMYYAFNKSNNSNNSAGDIIYLGQFNIASAVFNTVTEYEKTDSEIKMWYNDASTTLNFSYNLDQISNIVLSVQNLSGKLIVQQNIGTKNSGRYEEILRLEQKPASGVYIVSLFVDNNVFNRKIYID